MMNRRAAIAGGIAATVPLWPNRAGARFDRDGDSRRAFVSGQREEWRNLRVMNEWVENLTTGNGAANADLRTADMTVTVPAALPYGGTLLDADYAAALGEYLRPPTGPPARDAVLYADQDRVFLDGSFRAVGAATGVEFDVPVLEVFALVDGLVANDTIYYFDLDVLLAALGT